MYFALNKCWEPTHLWREEGKIILCMAKVDLIWNKVLNLKKKWQYQLSVLDRLQEYFSLQFHLSKTEKLETEDKQHINILFLFGIKFCHMFGNFFEILILLEEAAQNWH